MTEISNLTRLENALYGAIYGVPQTGDFKTIWNEIKKNPELMRQAVQVKRNKWNTGDTLEAITIADTMLVDYQSSDPEAYQSLVQTVFQNKDIARMVLDGASNGGYSFLLMCLWNPTVKLSEEQKQFAEEEAMYKAGTTLSKEEKVSSPNGSLPWAHGRGAYDIRYQILRNPNWSEAEKERLIYAFFKEDDYYREMLNDWEWGVVNDSFQEDNLPSLEIDTLYEETLDSLEKRFQDKKRAKALWDEIEFCRLMIKLRPPYPEKKYTKQ